MPENYAKWRSFNVPNIKLVDLDRSARVQSRYDTDPETVARYQEIWESGEADFPPCIVFQEGEKYHVADGFHRILGLTNARIDQRLECRTIACDVRTGTIEDAIKYSLGANSRHGLKPNTLDKKRSVMMYWGLSPVHCQHSSSLVGKACGVSHTFVADYRADVLHNLPSLEIFNQTRIPLPQIGNTILNLKLAEEAGEIITVRGGKELRQKVTPKALEEATKSLPKEHLMLPTEAEMSGLQISSKALPEPTLYIITTTASIIPRGTVIEGWESLTDTGNITTDWEAGTVLIANEDLIEIPYPIDSKVTLIDREMEIEHTVTGYSLVGTDLKIKSIDSNGYDHTHSSEMLKPFIKKDDVEKSTPPILDLSVLTTQQLEDIIATIGHEIHRRASLPQDIPDLAVC
jgi:hypothetical protein